jgi:hypothetical protein
MPPNSSLPANRVFPSASMWKSDAEAAGFSIKGVPGLPLRIMKSCFKSWSLIYRAQGGKRCRIHLGAYPGNGLKEAKREAQRLRVQTGDGQRPRPGKAGCQAPQRW